MNQAVLFEFVTAHLAQTDGLVRLLALFFASKYDDLPIPADKLVGEWESAVAGQKVRITCTDPYRCDEGYLFVLPGCTSTDILNGSFVHIPNSFDEDGEQRWFLLKHLIIVADQVELLPNW